MTPATPVQFAVMTAEVVGILVTSNLLPVGSTYADVVPAMLGGNAGLGIELAVAPPGTAYPYVAGLSWGSAGYSIYNSCPLGASVADVPAVAASVGGIPEFSCWNARANPASLGTRLNATLMGAVVTAVTTGPGLLGVTDGPLAGTANVVAIVQGAQALAAVVAAGNFAK